MTQRSYRSITADHLLDSLDLVQSVFTAHKDAREGELVRSLVEEIRLSQNHLPDLELIALDEADRVVGYAMFSRLQLEGRYGDELLMLSPVAVQTELQRQHISKELLEYGFARAAQLGFRAVLVEGNPANYRARGFVTDAPYGILPGKTVHLPHIDCLMVKELRPGALARIHGVVEYPYRALQ